MAVLPSLWLKDLADSNRLFCFRGNLICVAENASMPPLAGLSPVDYFPAMILVLICAKLGTLSKTIFDKML